MRLLKNLVAIPEEFSLQQRLFYASVLTGLMTSLFFNTAIFIVNPCPQYYIASLLFFLTCFLIFLGFKRKWRLERLELVFLLNGYLTIPYLWYITGGTAGPYLLHVILYISFFTLIFKGLKKWVSIGGMLLLVAVFTVIEIQRPGLIPRYTSGDQQLMELAIATILIAFALTMGLTLIINSYLKQKKELEKALEEIKSLHGIIPICSSCKKIRDDAGYWNFLETYIETHSDAMFTHSLCPDCTDELYGKEKWYIKRIKQEKDKEK